MKTMIDCKNLHLSFDRTRALDDVTTAIGGRKIVGLLGRNGSGKTTLLYTFLGLLKPTQGECRVFDRNSMELRREDMSRIGFVHQEGSYIETMSVQTHLDYIASFHRRWDKAREKKLLADFELDPDGRVGKLSTGDKQKLGIILAV